MSDADSRHSDQGERQSKVISMNPGELAVSRSDDGQYLLLYAGRTLLAVFGRRSGVCQVRRRRQICRRSSAGHGGGGVRRHPLYQSLRRYADERQVHYRDQFRSELDDEAIGNIRLTLAQSQPLGNDRFAEGICTKPGARRTNAMRGRSAGKAGVMDVTKEQTGFGF